MSQYLIVDLICSVLVIICISGVSLTDDEADNNQGSRYCLVAIGRLQVWNNIDGYKLFSQR